MFGFGWEFKEETINKNAVNAAIRARLRGRSGMFRFWPKANEKEAIIKAAISDVVLDQMSGLLTLVTYEVGVAHGLSQDEVKAKPLLEKQGKIIMGFEAVRMGYDPRGADPISDPISQGSAIVADRACYLAIISGTFDAQSIAGDLRHLLGFSRDGSEICQNAST